MSTCCGSDDARETSSDGPTVIAGMICYCFGESEASIRDEIETTGRSLAVARIREHIAAGRCACEEKNPRRVCCLGELMAAVRRVEHAQRLEQP